MKITVAIPTHDMKYKDYFLSRSLDALRQQTFKNFDVVISDNSIDDVLKDVAEKYTDLKIHYFKNHRKGMAQNTNEAIKESTGEIIKILYLDDYLAHIDSLKVISEEFVGGWLVTGCVHEYQGQIVNPHYPNFSPADVDNFVGSPSVLAMENSKEPIFFDEEMTWLLDLDYYKRLYFKYGMPKTLTDLNVAIGIGEHQMTNILSDELKLKEREYVNTKHSIK